MVSLDYEGVRNMSSSCVSKKGENSTLGNSATGERSFSLQNVEEAICFLLSTLLLLSKEQITASQGDWYIIQAHMQFKMLSVLS